MKSELFAHEMTETSSIFGRKKDITVVFEGDGAATDGNTVFLPSLTHGVEVEDETARVMRGFTDHEAGHLRHTDMDLFKAFAAECNRNNTPVLAAVHNCVEDMWMEGKVIDEYPGAQKNISSTAQHCNQMYLDGVEHATEAQLNDWMNVGPISITWEGRRDYEGVTNTQDCLDTISPEIAAKAKEWVGRISACESTADCITLSKEIYEEIKAKKEEETSDGEGSPDKPCPPDGRGEAPPISGGTEPPTDGSGTEPSGEAEPTGETETPPEGSGEDEPSGGSESGRAGDDAEEDTPSGRPSEGGEEESPTGGEETGASSEAEPDPISGEFRKAVEDIVGKKGLTETGRGKYRPFTTRYDHVVHRNGNESWSSVRTLNKGTARGYDRVVSRMQSTVSSMRRKLERALVASQQRNWEGGRIDGRLDSRRLVAAVGGHEHVFKMKSESKDIDTAVCILVDMSGSMEGIDIRVAKEVAIALCQTLERTNVAYELLGFTTDEWRADDELDAMYRSGEYTRRSPLEIFVFKAFEERLFDCKGAIDSMTKHQMHHNVDGESVLFAAERLEKRPEKRHILMTLSDGYPEYRGSLHHQHLRDVIDLITARGVEPIGVGIRSDAVQKFYPRWTVVNDLDDLAKGSLDILAKLLIDDKFTVDNSGLMKVARSAS